MSFEEAQVIKVATVGDLSAVPVLSAGPGGLRTGYSDGQPGFVTTGGAVYILETSSASVDGTNTLATRDDPTRRWILQGTGTGGVGVTSFNGSTGAVTYFPVVNTGNIAALASLPATLANGYQAGSIAYVTSVDDMWVLRPSALPTDGITIVNNAASPGTQWIRLLTRSAKWQAQTTWSVDGSNTSGVASDENSGIDDAHPLLTHAECVRRLGALKIPAGTKYLVRHMSTSAAGDSGLYDVSTVANEVFFSGAVPDAISNLFGAFTIIGVPTVVYSGTMSTVVQTASGAVGDNHFTDAGIAFSNANGRLWKRTSTPAGFWPQKDSGANVKRISQAGRTTARVVLASNDPYSVLQLPGLADVGFKGPQLGGFPTLIMQCLITSTASFNDTFKGGPSAYMFCDLTPVSGNLTFEGAIAMINCRNPLCFADTLAGQPKPQVMGGLVDSAGGAGQALGANGGMFMGQGFALSFQGVSLPLDHMVELTEADLMFYDCVDCISINVARVSSLVRADISSLGGSGNTGNLISNNGSGSMVTIQVVGTGATSGTAYKLNAVPSATVPVVEFATKCNCIVAQ